MLNRPKILKKSQADEAKRKAIQLKQDAEEIKSFVKSTGARETHAARLDEIKEHVNNLGELVTKMRKARATASSWQRQLISEVIPLLKELAASVTATIEHLNDNTDDLANPPYLDYASANADYASDISQLISDEVAYSEAKHTNLNLSKAQRSTPACLLPFIDRQAFLRSQVGLYLPRD